MAERFTQRTQLGQQNLSSGTASNFMQLGDTFNSISQQVSQEVARNVAGDSFQSGQEVLVDGEAPQFKKERFIGGIESTNFNKGLRNAYVASVANDSREALNQIELENPTDVIAYNQKAEAYKSGVLKEVDGPAASIVQQQLDQSMSTGRTRVQERGFKQQAAKALEESNAAAMGFGGDASRFARNGDTEASAASLRSAAVVVAGQVDAGQITAQQGEDRMAAMSQEVNEQEIRKAINDTADNEGFEAAYDQINDVADTIPNGWAPDQWDAFMADAQSDLNRKAARAKQEAKVNAKAVNHQLSIDRGMLFQDQNIPADPAKGSQDRKDVNNAYESQRVEWEQLPVDQQVELNINFIKGTGIVPDNMIGNINAAARSGNTDQAMLTSNLVARIQELPNAAAAIRDIPDESRAFSVQVADSVRSGMEPEQAIEIARKNTYGVTKQQREKIKIQTQAVAKDMGSMLNKRIDDQFTTSSIPFVGNPPSIPVDMQADYNVAFDGFMTLTDGDSAQADALAFDTLKKRWAITEVGGDQRFMKSAPEAFYAVEGFDNEWIDRQFLGDMDGAGIVGASISADFNTGRSDAPSYPVMITNDQGITDIARSETTGLPLRWKPDFKQSDEYKEIEAAPGKAVESAKAKRERQFTQRANFIRRKVQSAAFSGVPRSERGEMLASEEGVSRIRTAVNNLAATEKIDRLEAEQILEAFSAGDFDSLPVAEFR
ncbi:hypothetical protein N9878_00900 [bacterium]|nr:hypothetical protein [bacterium]